jgi:hypothetical protein
MNKTVIIIGTLSLVGVGAYLYFKQKKDDKKLPNLGLPNLDNSQSSTLTPQQVEVIKNNIATGNITMPTGITLTTPEQVVQVVNIANQQNQASTEAQSIVSQIISSRSQLNSLVNPTPFSTTNSLYSNYLFQRGLLVTKINALITKLKAIGYKEVSGKAVKIV